MATCATAGVGARGGVPRVAGVVVGVGYPCPGQLPPGFMGYSGSGVSLAVLPLGVSSITVLRTLLHFRVGFTDLRILAGRFYRKVAKSVNNLRNKTRFWPV